jgi:hypothetical protein
MTSHPSKLLNRPKTTEPGVCVVLQESAENYYFTCKIKLKYEYNNS